MKNFFSYVFFTKNCTAVEREKQGNFQKVEQKRNHSENKVRKKTDEIFRERKGSLYTKNLLTVY